MLSNPIVIFVRPRAEGNIGALARVMSNFGVQELRIVGEVLKVDASYELKKESAPLDWAMACKGQSVLENSQNFSTLEEATQDIHWVLGSSARKREGDCGYTRPTGLFEELLQQKALTWNDSHKWALVLGSEDNGLTEEEVSLCHALCHIPTSSENPAMNIAMAAGCLLYHWKSMSLNRAPSTIASHNVENVTAGDINKLAEYIFATLTLSEFFKYPDKEAVLARTRRIFQSQENLDKGDILFLFEIFYQLRSKIQGFHENRNFLSK
jgi:tRNA/rRNA methyltransferase